MRLYRTQAMKVGTGDVGWREGALQHIPAAHCAKVVVKQAARALRAP